MNRKTTQLRQLFSRGGIIRVMGAHDGLGARLIERNGFDAVWSSGLEISTAHALPDANLLTMTENLAAAQGINDATHLPVICDCDTGYGNSTNVMHMVKKYEAAGLAAVVIEDKRFPKINSFIPGRQELAGIHEFAGKLQAAKSVQNDPDFMVIARTEALIAGWGMDEALRRAIAYEQAGADAIVIHSRSRMPDEVYEFASKWKGSVPLIAIPTMYPDVTAAQLEAAGYGMVIYANHGLRASIRAMDEVMRLIAETGSLTAVEGKIAGMDEVFEIQRMTAMREDEKRFTGRESLNAVIPAAGNHALESDLGDVLGDKPVCMLNVGAKTLIDRQTDLLRSAGVSDIWIVGGHQHDKIRSDGSHIIHNPRYDTCHNAYSLMQAEAHMGTRCVVAYSDIIYDRQILNHLLMSPHDITLVMDRAYQTLPARDKKHDLVIAENSSVGFESRRLDASLFLPVRRIGKELDKARANYEFIGLALFQGQGIHELRAAWRDALSKFRDKQFNEAPSAEKASLPDLIQYLIERGAGVYGMQIEHGWSEIQSKEDYRRVDSYFQPSSAQPSQVV